MFPLLKHRASCTIYGTSFKPFIKYRIIHFLMGFSIGSSGQHPNASQIPTDVSSEQADEDGKRWGPEGGKPGQVTEVLKGEDQEKSLWVWCVQGEIKEKLFSELKLLALLSSRPCSNTSRGGPSSPGTSQTCTKWAPWQGLVQECTLGELLPTCAVHSLVHSELCDLLQERSLGSHAFVLPVLGNALGCSPLTGY